MLGDATGLARHHVGRTDRIQQRRLAVVDVAHHGNDRRPRHHVLGRVGGSKQPIFDVGFGDALDGVSQFLGDQLRSVGVDHVGDLHHLPLLHQDADDVDGSLRHAVGEFLDGDRFRNGDFADELFLAVAGVPLEPLHTAAE